MQAWVPKVLPPRQQAHILELRTLTCEIRRTEAKVAGQVSSPISAGTTQRWHFKERCCLSRPRLQTAKSSWAPAFISFWGAVKILKCQPPSMQYAARSSQAKHLPQLCATNETPAVLSHGGPIRAGSTLSELAILCIILIEYYF